MTYGKLSDRCLKVFIVLLIAGVLGGFCLPHFVEAVAGGYNTRAVGMSLGAEGLAAPVLSADFKPQGGELAVGDRFVISKAANHTKICKLHQRSFLEILRKKMGNYS